MERTGVKRKCILPKEYKQFLHVDKVEEEKEEDSSNFLNAIDNESKSNTCSSCDESDQAESDSYSIAMEKALEPQEATKKRGGSKR